MTELTKNRMTLNQNPAKFYDETAPKPSDF